MEQIAQLLSTIVAFLWFFLVVIVLILFYKPIRHELLPKLRGFKAMGVEFSFIKDSINAAIEFGEKNEQWM